MNAKIGSQLRKVTVTDIAIEPIITKDKNSEKIVFTVYDNIVKREFKISDCWIDTTIGGVKIAGLWYLASEDGIISPNSALAKLLHHYQITSLAGMLNLSVNVYPDPKGYLVLVGYPCNEKELEEKLQLLKK